MSTNVFQPAAQISCHAWSPDRKRIAVCENTEFVYIYSNADKPYENWVKEHTLKGHDLLVTAIDWSAANGKIVTCSHDRNAFVWTLEGKEWMPSLSILRINRAALSVKWSPDGTKFAVASGAKVVPVCHYEKANDWWISKMIKKHKSTVLDVAWHPNSQLVATASCDFKCRVFSAYIPEVKGGNPSTRTMLGDVTTTAFGDLLAEFDSSNGWVESCAWSPSGQKLAFTGHDSSLSVVQFPESSGGSRPTCQTIKGNSLPNITVLFLSDNVLIGGGHDRNPHIYQSDSKGYWTLLGMADSKSGSSSPKAKASSGFSSARDKFKQMVTRGQESDSASAAMWTKHTNAITCMKPYGDGTWKSKTDSFTTSGMDGRIVVWSAKNISKSIPDLKL